MKTMTASWLCLVCLWVQGVLAQLNGLRLCVPDTFSAECQKMQATIGQSRIQCILARDKLECMDLVRKDKADLVKATAEDIYTAGYEFGLAPFVMEEVGRNTYEYRSAAVVLRSSPVRSLRNLRDRRACMDRCVGSGSAGARTSDASWHIPVSTLLDRRSMDPDCHGEDFTVSKFFSSACVSGPWSRSSVVDDMLKRKFSKLCSECKDPDSCSSSASTETSSSGCERATALDCLADGRGDVAFVDTQDVGEFLLRRPDQRGNLEFLCLDGSRRPLREVQDANQPGCVWNQRPTTAFMGDSDKVHLRYNYERTLRQVFQNHRVRPPSWFRRILVSSDAVTDLLPVPDSRDTWNTYLAGYRVPLEKELPNCEPKQIRLCVWNDADATRCDKWARASFPRRLRPRLRCERRPTTEECVETVAHRQAEIVILPAGQAYKQAKSGKLRMLAVEEHDGSGTEEEDHMASMSYTGDYAVAVIRKSTDIKSIDDLKGKRSCHSGISELAGWAMPLSVMLETGALNELDCNRADAVARFFSAGSCVPGATNGSSLCSQCRADDDRFPCDPEMDRYAGDEGALRCLSEGGGDVAFVRHWVTELIQHPSSRRQYFPGHRMNAQNYVLLCPPQETDEDQRQTLSRDVMTTAALADFRHCNWGKVPPSYVMISTETSEDVQLELAQFLAEASRIFSKGMESDMAFRLFGGSPHNSSEINEFFSGSTGLKILPFHASFREAMDPKTLQIVEAADSEQCSQRLTDGASASVIAPYLAITFVWLWLARF